MLRCHVSAPSLRPLRNTERDSEPAAAPFEPAPSSHSRSVPCTVHVQPSAQHNLQLRLDPSSIGTRFGFMQSCPCICDAVSMHMCEVRYLSATCERAVREDVDATPVRGGAAGHAFHTRHGEL